MNGHFETSVNRNTPLDSFAAELALAAYRVALQTRTRGTWLDLELDLWRALVDTVDAWGTGIASVPPAGDTACRVKRR
jgi:hypothetical protein